MVNQPATRRHHRSRITCALGLLALLGAMTILVVLARDPALSSTRLVTPVPAPEITVVDSDPVDDAAGWIGAEPPEGQPETTGPAAGSGAGGQSNAQQETTDAAPARHTATDVRRSLFWSGLFGLTISLAGLGLVGTRRRMW
ncbi:hypothetical protein [Micromonospora profundi]|uniref:hypothetical protein n=1 Tax=Micromonospora profundi TaxID=1420889 RepID=UPI00365070DB